MPPSDIGWTDDTLNFYSWNCNEISPGCAHCYARERAKIYWKNAMGGEFNGVPMYRAAAVDELRKTPSGKVIFVNSHSDTFHEGIPLETIQRVFAHLNSRPDLIFLLLTKRPMVALQHAPHLRWGDNIWLGVSVESSKYLKRVNILGQIPAAHKFISFEPLLENINVYEGVEALRHVQWAIVGGESGERRRPFNKWWAKSMLAACREANVPFFFKQGSHLYSGQDRELDGQEYNECPPEFAALHQQHQKPSQLSMF